MTGGDPLDLPPCPITGRPAKRAVHGVSARMVETLWRVMQGVDVSRLFAGTDRLRLYESETGLFFFEPRVVGDAAFYRDYYTRWNFHARLARSADRREDYAVAARVVAPGAAVIDVGCGACAFSRHVPHARYTGLDPYAETDTPLPVVREALDTHAETHWGFYDVACAFHVLEHVADPLAHARGMAKLLRPGGLLVIVAPMHPSPMTEIPNFFINIPPQHVTWWNPPAFRALAAEAGLEVVEAGTVPPSPFQATIVWLQRLLPSRTVPAPQERFISHRWRWHLSMMLAYPLAELMSRLVGLPKKAAHLDAFLVARKPDAPPVD
jgi:SAM-dependent methyltransferase